MAVYRGVIHHSDYVLGNPLTNGMGGEGTVYDICGSSGQVAKLYHPEKLRKEGQELEEKILYMIHHRIDVRMGNLIIAAWPQDALYDRSGRFTGYVMPRLRSSHKIIAAERSDEREQLFPDYTWKYAVYVAYNLAAVVKKMHDQHVVIGDMNYKNIIVDNHCHVYLCDCDSFNIVNASTGKVYKTKVGLSELIPPELQGRDLSRPSSIFTEQSDDFGMAIHIFMLLMNDCHPFACIHKSGLEPSRTSVLCDNIVTGYCPYFTGVGRKSKDAPDMRILPEKIRNMFDRVFHYTEEDAAVKSTICRRPSADEWAKVLLDFAWTPLAVCRRDKKHIYPKWMKVCPWCAMEKIHRPCF